MSRFATVSAILSEAVAGRAFPAAVIEVGRHDAPLWREAFGTLTSEPDAPRASADTIFDLASLTKIIATTTLAMRLIDRQRLRLDDPVGRWLPDWRGDDRTHVTLEDLFAHASGLTAHLPFFRDHQGRVEFQHAICALPLEYPPRTASVYSDLGYILLGFVLEDAGSAGLAGQFAALAADLGLSDLAFHPPRAWRARTAPTEIDSWRGRLLVGDVHDENAWALGGAAGHAGLFGSAPAVGTFARAVLRTRRGAPLVAEPGTLIRFTRPSAVPGSSRALGWDTMLPTSSCGRRMSASAIGHTGFTGTSLWIDPDADVYVVLLTNRVHPSRQNDAILEIRPRVHDAVMECL